MCGFCGGKFWTVNTRHDGRKAVERCDMCSKISDEEAAELATTFGVLCKPTYPCYVIEKGN